MDAFMHISIYV